MSAVDYDTAERVRGHLRSVCRRQWQSLGAAAPGAAPAKPSASVIDPEALLLLSLLEAEDAELGEHLSWWAAVGCRLLSTARLRALLARCPDALAAGLKPFAAQAVRTGDRRWRLWAERTSGVGRDGAAAMAEPQLQAPAALMLRLRQSLGLGNAADMLAVLLGLASDQNDHPAWLTIEGIAAALRCSVPAARRAAAQLLAAGDVQASVDRPVLYTVAADAALRYATRWPATSAGPGDALVLPPWRPWASVLEIISRGLALLGSGGALREDQLREAAGALLTSSRGLLLQCGVTEAPEASIAGAELTGLARVLTAVAAWADNKA